VFALASGIFCPSFFVVAKSSCAIFFAYLSIIGGKTEHYLKSNCSFLFIPDQTSNATTFLVRLDDECSIRIRNHTVITDCVALIGVVVRKKASERCRIGSELVGLPTGVIRSIIQPHFSALCPGNRYPTPPNCFHNKTDKYILEFLYVRLGFVNALRGTFGG